MPYRSPEEVDHTALVRHEVGHALVSALLTGMPGSIELKRDGNGDCESRLPSSLESPTQVELCRLHVLMAGAADAFTSADGLQDRYSRGCRYDLGLARESAARLTACSVREPSIRIWTI